MNPVLSHPAPAHDDQISGTGLILMAGTSLNHRGHDAKGRNKHKAFAHVSVVKNYLTKGGGHPAFITPVLDALNDPVQKSSGMQRRLQRSKIRNCP